MDESELLAAAPRDKPYKLYPGQRGVYLLIRPSGAKLWRYNVRRAGINTTLSLGAFPAVSLVEAVEERDRIHSHARMGIHPTVARRAFRRSETLGGAGAAFALSVSSDGALSLTVAENTMHLTRYQTDAIRAALIAGRESVEELPCR